VNCPACGIENDRSAESCIDCGKALYALTRGTVLSDRYEILGTLGRGGMGIVYKALDRELEETVAIKLLRADVVHSADAAKRFRNEIRLARRVRHRNVCAIHEYGQQAHLRYIVMEYVEGTDYKQIIRSQGPLSAADACAVAIQVADALQAIHDAGVVHRDLKTPNIMRDGKGIVRLMDFGIAKQFESDTGTGATAPGLVVGTPEYMSPEQACAEKVDARSDLYALAIVLHELLTGDVPFRGDSPLATLLKHQSEPPPLESPRLPEPFLPILRIGLAKDRRERYQTAEDMATALREVRSALGGSEMARPRVPSIMNGRRTATALEPEIQPDTQVVTTPIPTPLPTPVPAAEAVATTPMPPLTPSMRSLPVESRPAHDRVAPNQRGHSSQVEAQRVSTAPDRPRTAPSTERLRGQIPRLVGVAAVVGIAALGAATWFILRTRTTPSAETAPSPVVVAQPTASAGRPDERDSQVTAKPSAGVVAPVPTRRATVAAAVARATPSPSPSASQAEQSARQAANHQPPPVVAGAEPKPATAGTPLEAMPSPDRTPNAGAAPSNGTLQVGARPFAEVIIDGASVGTTPLGRLTLTAGTHTVRFLHPDYQPFSRRLTVKPGETTKFTLDWSLDGIRK
jgi:serine/threonine-protein kinase